MSMTDPLIQELEQETTATRRMLERVPGDKLDWKPHEKSRSLGQLALHVAGTPGAVAGMLAEDEIPVPDFGSDPSPESTDELIGALEESVARAKEVLSGMSDEEARSPFRVVKDGEAVMEIPKIGVARAIMLNHWYHHRGQLSVYLRLLDVPVPATYGDSADEHPWG